MKKLVTFLVFLLLGAVYAFGENRIAIADVSVSPSPDDNVTNITKFTLTVRHSHTPCITNSADAISISDGFKFYDASNPGMNLANVNVRAMGGDYVDFTPIVSEPTYYSIDIPLNSSITLEAGKVYTLYIDKLLISDDFDSEYAELADNIELTYYGPSDNALKVADDGITPAQNASLKQLDTIRVEFSQNVAIKDGSKATLYQNYKNSGEMEMAIASILPDANDTKKALIVFDTTALKRNVNYSVVVPGKVFSESGKSDNFIADEIEIKYKGDSVFTDTLSFIPRNNALVSALNAVQVSFIPRTANEIHAEKGKASISVECIPPKPNLDFSGVAITTTATSSNNSAVPFNIDFSSCPVYDTGTYVITVSGLRVGKYNLTYPAGGGDNYDTFAPVRTLAPFVVTIRVDGSKYAQYRENRLNSHLELATALNAINRESLSFSVAGKNENLFVESGTYATVKDGEGTILESTALVKVSSNKKSLILTPNPLPNEAGTYTISIAENAVSYQCQPFEQLDGTINLTQLWVETPTVKAEGKKFGDSYVDSVQITLKCATDEAQIVYWYQGLTPTLEWQDYTQPFAIKQNTNGILVKATKEGLNPSAQLTTKSYSFVPSVAKPVFTPQAGEYINSVDVKLSSSTDQAGIYYYIVGSGEEDFTFYKADDEDVLSDLHFTTTTTIKAYASKSGSPTSDTVEVTYTVLPKLASVVANPAAGTYPDSVLVKLSAASGASVSYRTAAGDAFAAYPATGVWIKHSCTLEAFASKEGSANSDTLEAAYTVLPKLPKPRFEDWSAGAYQDSAKVEFACDTPNVEYHYRLNETGAFLTDYTKAFYVDETTTVEVFATKDGRFGSDTAKAVFTVAKTQPVEPPTPVTKDTVDAPAFVGWSAAAYQDSALVDLKCDTVGAKVWFRKGETGAFAEFTSAFYVKETTTIYAYGSKQGLENSDTLYRVYTVSKTPQGGEDPQPVDTFYVITVLANDTTMGTVSGGGRFKKDTTVVLTAVAKDGYKFVKWNDEVTEATREIKVVGDSTFTATFEAESVTPQPVDTFYVITVLANDTTMGTVSGGGRFKKDTTVVLTAVAKDGYKFVRWNDDASAEAVREVKVVSDSTFTATFEAESVTPQPVDTFYVITVLANDTTMGTVSGGGRFKKDTTVVLTAVAKDGYKFVKWNDDASAEAVREVKVVSDSTFTATFEKLQGVGVDRAGEVSFGIYPNPNDGRFTVEVAEDATMEIYNAAGVRVLSGFVPAGRRAVSLNASGIYFVKMTAGGRSTVKRVIVR